jgi:hypothetical protein
MKKFIVPSLLLFSVGAHATSYQSFSELSYLNTNNDDGFAFNTHYFLEPRKMIGVLDEFGTIYTNSNFYGGINNLNSETDFNIGGEYFLPNNVFVFGEFASQGNFDGYSAGAGYLLNDNFKFSGRYTDYDIGDGQVFGRVEYNHQINEIDYLAFSFDSEIDFDTWQLEGRYFMALSGSQHLGVDASLRETGFDVITRIYGTYYFNPALSVGVGVNDSEIELGAKYYLDTNFAFSLDYLNINETFALAVHGQF